MQDRWMFLAPLALCGAICGCVSTANLTTAKAIGQGRAEFGLHAGTWGRSDGVHHWDHDLDASIGFHGRFGLTERTDLGIMMDSRSYGRIDLKLTLLDGPGAAVAIDPGLGIAMDVEQTAAELRAPLLIDLVFGAHRLVLAPSYHYVMMLVPDGSPVHFANIDVGLRIALTDVLYVMPNGGVAFRPESPSWDDLVWHAGVAFQVTVEGKRP